MMSSERSLEYLLQLLHTSQQQPSAKEALEAACKEAYEACPGHIITDRVSIHEEVHTWRGGCLAWVDLNELPSLQTLLAHDGLPWEHAVVTIEPHPCGGMRAMLLKVKDVLLSPPRTKH